MEYDTGENFTGFDDEYSSSTSTYLILHDIFFILILIVAICANVTIIYIIVRFKHMRGVENLFLASWALADIASLIITPLGYKILLIAHVFLNHEYTECILFHIAGTLQATTVLFVILITIDWYLITFFKKTSQTFRKFNKFLICAVWLTSLLVSAFTSGYCLADQGTIFPALSFLILFCALILIIIALQITRGVRKCVRRPIESSTLMLTLSTTFLGCWLSSFILVIVFDVAQLDSIMSIISEAILFGSSIVTLALLYRFNTEFQSCFMQVLKRSSKYEDRICNIDNPSVTNMIYINHKDSIKLLFENREDALFNNAH